MGTRVSLAEAYDNKDVISQIYRLMDEMDVGTIKDIAASKDASTGIITLSFTMNDDTVKEFSIPTVDGVTLDTEQVITAAKTFDADVTIGTGHDLSVANKLSVGGDLDIGGSTAIENSSGDLVISPTNRMIVKTGAGANQEMVVGTDSVIVDKLVESTTPDASSDVKTATNIEYVSKTDGSNNLAHTNPASQSLAGVEIFPDWIKISGAYDNLFAGAVDRTATWVRLWRTTDNTLTNQTLTMLTGGQKGNHIGMAGIVAIYGSSAVQMKRIAGIVSEDNLNKICAVKTVDGSFEIWGYCTDSNTGIYISRLSQANWGAINQTSAKAWVVDGVTQSTTFDPTDTSVYSSYSYIIA